MTITDTNSFVKLTLKKMSHQFAPAASAGAAFSKTKSGAHSRTAFESSNGCCPPIMSITEKRFLSRAKGEYLNSALTGDSDILSLAGVGFEPTSPAWRAAVLPLDDPADLSLC